eukprot:TRINITY_DN1018_c0_g1_i1.p1 TRINITY_DN1018_c0_g1~~TRINITY_DN1018_c0_g1_i1.p1  ORF type:complete len:314 (+),score=114.45 TRINITY_DN1018_c0_g1_i1:163-1104(+)
MGFVKVQKDKAYFKRFQVKFKRRREGKTDYKARKNLIKQDKNKYNTPKYRFVVRFTNADIICQVIAAKIVGDFVLTAAYAHELPNYGVKTGLTNYSAAYCVGLLCARRLLKKLGLDGKFKGKKEANGKFYLIRKLSYKHKKVLRRKHKKIRDRAHPFVALLDVGLRKTSTGAKVFAALKGAVDGGLSIPHNPKRFVGFNKETQKLDSEALRKRIFGGHVADWMKKLKEEDEKKYSRQFSLYIKEGITSDKVESVYANAHKQIRANPEKKKTTKVPSEKKPKNYSRKRLTASQRKDRIRQKMASFQKKVSAKNN